MASSYGSDTDVASARAYPSQREAARLLRVSESTLSKSDAPSLRGGDRGRHYSPRVILELAAHYRRRSLNEVAADLVAHVVDNAPEDESVVRREIDDFFAHRSTPAIDKERFLAEARRTLPRRLYEQVRRAYDAEPDQIVFVSHGDREATSASAEPHPAH